MRPTADTLPGRKQPTAICYTPHRREAGIHQPADRKQPAVSHPFQKESSKGPHAQFRRFRQSRP